MMMKNTDLHECFSTGVGKSSLLLRFISDKFIENNEASIGVESKVKTIVLNNQFVRLRIWDVAGLEQFRALIPE